MGPSGARGPTTALVFLATMLHSPRQKLSTALNYLQRSKMRKKVKHPNRQRCNSVMWQWSKRKKILSIQFVYILIQKANWRLFPTNQKNCTNWNRNLNLIVIVLISFIEMERQQYRKSNYSEAAWTIKVFRNEILLVSLPVSLAKRHKCWSDYLFLNSWIWK